MNIAKQVAGLTPFLSADTMAVVVAELTEAQRDDATPPIVDTVIDAFLTAGRQRAGIGFEDMIGGEQPYWRQPH